MKKRGISILLALLLIVSLLPGAAFAQDGGTVRVIAENKTFTEPVDGVAPAWTGTLFDETVTRTDGMTMMDALETAAGQAGKALTVTSGAYGDYLSGVAGLNGSDTARGGWMGTLNDWFTDTSMDSTAVADGDVVRVQYSCNWGADIGSDWGSTDVSLRSLRCSAGALSPAFSGEATSYTLTVPAGTQQVTVTPSAVNKNNKVTVLADGETDARWGARTVAVADGDVITVRVGSATVYTVYTIAVRSAAPEHACAGYTDLTNDWARAGICYVIDHGIMTGTDTNVFSPNLSMSRAMLVTVLWRIDGRPAAAAADFTDVAGGTWYGNAVAWAQETGVVDGYPDGTFAPMKAVSREELATILYRYAEVSGLDITAADDLSAFADSASVQPYARAAMQWAVGSGLISGLPDALLAPRGTATRAQAAVILWRLLDADTALKAAAHCLLSAVPAPAYGDEWLVLDLARGGVATPPAYETYYAQVEACVREKNGVLSDRYYTEYARVALAVTAIGRDAANVAGYDLVAPLTDVDKVASQGVNGVIYALLALDSGSYEADVRAQYVEKILAAQLPDGGFTYMEGDPADPDLTAMALQALAPYHADAQVSAAVDRALNCLSAMQQADGGFVSWGASSAESTAQAILALCTLGVDLQDSRFVKDGHSLLDNLMTFQLANGGFCHTADGGYNAMTTEQALRALVAVQRAEANETALYQVR